MPHQEGHEARLFPRPFGLGLHEAQLGYGSQGGTLDQPVDQLSQCVLLPFEALQTLPDCDSDHGS